MYRLLAALALALQCTCAEEDTATLVYEKPTTFYVEFAIEKLTGTPERGMIGVSVHVLWNSTRLTFPGSRSKCFRSGRR
jgi:hypothetical protein